MLYALKIGSDIYDVCKCNGEQGFFMDGIVLQFFHLEACRGQLNLNIRCSPIGRASQVINSTAVQPIGQYLVA